VVINASDQELGYHCGKLEIIITIVGDDVAEGDVVVFEPHYPAVESVIGHDIRLQGRSGDAGLEEHLPTLQG
jgi:hypothetical protein